MLSNDRHRSIYLSSQTQSLMARNFCEFLYYRPPIFVVACSVGCGVVISFSRNRRILFLCHPLRHRKGYLRYRI